MEAWDVLELVKRTYDDPKRQKAAMESSAEVALEDAYWLYNEGNQEGAKQRALRSLQYMVGNAHPTYIEASKK